jgi:predicted HTH domain antitoxin
MEHMLYNMLESNWGEHWLCSRSEEGIMKQVVLELPDDMARQIGPYQGRIQELVLLGLSQLKAQDALTLYTRGVVSFARAAEIAGLTRPEMVRQARALGVRPRWSEQMVEEELA